VGNDLVVRRSTATAQPDRSFAMPDSSSPVYSVDAQSDPVVIKVQGRASFQNSGCIQDFFRERVAAGKTRFVMDFAACTSMDSTFLGVLAGTALQLRKQTPPGALTLARMGARNLELVRNLGLHRLLTIDAGEASLNLGAPATALTCQSKSELESAKLVLGAHEHLISVDEANRAKFEDVLSFLKKRVEQG
jgi:anti-sigma B factor antagonist